MNSKSICENLRNLRLNNLALIYLAYFTSVQAGGFIFSKCFTKKSKRLCSPYSPPIVCPTPGKVTSSKSFLAYINALAT